MDAAAASQAQSAPAFERDDDPADTPGEAARAAGRAGDRAAADRVRRRRDAAAAYPHPRGQALHGLRSRPGHRPGLGRGAAALGRFAMRRVMDATFTPAMVDVAFALAGRQLPRQHRHALADALLRALPWLADE